MNKTLFVLSNDQIKAIKDTDHEHPHDFISDVWTAIKPGFQDDPDFKIQDYCIPMKQYNELVNILRNKFPNALFDWINHGPTADESK
jgi:hypothetical protein